MCTKLTIKCVIDYKHISITINIIVKHFKNLIYIFHMIVIHSFQ